MADSGSSSGEFHLSIWTIYERPKDFPLEPFVVKEMRLLQGRVEETVTTTTADTLNEARSVIPEEAVNIGREPGDDPGIIESWF